MSILKRRMLKRERQKEDEERVYRQGRGNNIKKKKKEEVKYGKSRLHDGTKIENENKHKYV